MSPQALVATVVPEEARGNFRRLLAYLGPALLVSVGYLDPGNWATDLEAGARFGTQLLWVLVGANAIALLMQTLAARLGIVSRLDLAQCCRHYYARPIAVALFVLCAVAIVACDVAEVIGSAVALEMLFGIPLAWGAALTALDVLALLALRRLGMRGLEAIVLVLVVTVGGCLLVEWWLAAPAWSSLAAGLRPRLHAESVYIAVAMLGATVMPHNLYLHSWVVQSRAPPRTPDAQRRSLRLNLLDTVLALNVAFCVNVAILVVAAQVFHSAGMAVTDLREAQRLLDPLLGTTLAGLLFALALLCAGQSATITGTLAAQVAVQGFLGRRAGAASVRIATRAIAVVPAVVALAVLGDGSTVMLLVASQVVLSLQLPFALVPLIRFTSDRSLMGMHANGWLLRAGAWSGAAVVIACNAWLVFDVMGSAMPGARVALFALAAAAAMFLGYLAWVPLRTRSTPVSSSRGGALARVVFEKPL